MPKVSVVIPSYNCARYLPAAVDSVRAQSYPDTEIIVVDDGSTDETPAIAERYGRQIVYIRTANRGAAAARNRGIRASNGEYLAFLDADDWWEPTKLAEQVPELEKDETVGLVYTDMRVHYDDGTTLDSLLSTKPLAGCGYIFDQLMQSQFVFPSTTLLRMSCVRKVGPFDESMRSLEDCDFLLRLCYRWKVALVRKPLVHRRERAGNLSSNEGLHTRYIITFHEKALQLPSLNASRFRHFQHRLARAHLRRACYCFRQQQIAECRRNLQSSLKYDWKNLGALRFLLASYLPGGGLQQLSVPRDAR